MMQNHNTNILFHKMVHECICFQQIFYFASCKNAACVVAPTSNFTTTCLRFRSIIDMTFVVSLVTMSHLLSDVILISPGNCVSTGNGIVSVRDSFSVSMILIVFDFAFATYNHFPLESIVIATGVSPTWIVSLVFLFTGSITETLFPFLFATYKRLFTGL